MLWNGILNSSSDAYAMYHFSNLLIVFQPIGTLTFDGNFMDGRAPIGVCALRDAELNKFIVDCPSLLGESQIVVGIICSVPNCCTECI